MHRSTSSFRLLSLAAIALTLFLSSCGGTTSREVVASALPSYRGYEASLFDDGIDARALGYSFEAAVSPKEDRLLRERTRVGDRVVRAHVISITSTRDASGPTWQIGLHTVEKLAGKAAAEPDFTLRLNGTAPGAGVMRALDDRLIGVSLVAFVREFDAAYGAGRGELHFHLAGEDQDELDAVRVAALGAGLN
jgi:hypothetical protein